MKKCRYCKTYTVIDVPYNKTLEFRGIPIHQHGSMEHCTNPDCVEPNRFSKEQRAVLDQQFDEQVGI